MKNYLLIGLGLVLVSVVLLFTFRAEAGLDNWFYDNEPDIPAMLLQAKSQFSKEEFMRQRSEGQGYLRGFEPGKTIDPTLRTKAIQNLEKQELDLKRGNSPVKQSLLAAWTEIGPNPIPNGQVSGGTSTPVSGRTISIAIHPTNPNLVYVGTAQGGLYRTTDGGTTWTAMMDNALSLAIGAVAISPSQPETIYVGTGEHNFSVDSFFGVGVYRIDNASSTNPIVTGPLNKDATNADIFTGRGISEVLVHPTDPNTIFVASTSGLGGIGGVTNNTLPSRGIYRSTNATTANPTFTKLTGLASNLDASVRDIAFDPANPNLLVAGLVASGGIGGIYTSTNALSASPTFTQTSVFNSTSTNELTAEFAVHRNIADPNPTFYAGVGNLGGRVLRSIDGGITWTEQVDNNFCTPQCFYNIAIDVDPNDASRVYVGGSPSVVIATSTNSGASFVNSSVGVHVDTHVVSVSKSNPSTIYLGTDGGIYKSIDSGSTWTPLNNTTFRATQFMSIAVHPTDGNFTIGGTQDNGTNHFRSDRTWFRVDGGDGGYTVIDRNATDTTTVRMYHTYFNNGSLQGYGTTNNGTSPVWSFRGCQAAGSTVNGITCNGSVLFYAPLEQGPGNPNTIYYGTDRLYRSTDNGLTHTVVSQNPIVSGAAISAIGISQQNDNIRLVGLRNGGIFGTTTGSTTLTDLDTGNTVPNGFVARAEIDPNNSNTAYVTLAVFGVSNTVWKTTNLNAATPTWTAASGSGGNALPAVPASAFVIDPLNSNRLYVGTDIGVYTSGDGGATWSPFGTGLPRVAVFDMAITVDRKVRIATHGRGMWEIPVFSTARRPFADFDGDGKTDISVFRSSTGAWFVQRSLAGFYAVSFGQNGDKVVSADFSGDGRAEAAIFRPSDNTWYVFNTVDNTFYGIPFGTAGDIPIPADFDGDSKADINVFRPSTGFWFRNNSSNGAFVATPFGQNGDIPTPEDYDGDGKADISIWRPSDGGWYRLNSSNSAFFAVAFGQNGDRVVPADYTGDGKADIAVFRAGTWFVLRSEDLTFFGIPFGLATDIPAQGDFDGDGKDDIAVYRNGTWFIQQSTSGFLAFPFGLTGDINIPNKYQ